MEQKFYVCAHCGSIIAFAKNTGVPVMCCGQRMQELVPGTVEAVHEKHIPVIAADGNIVTVTVGAVEHPMVDAHYIEWICLSTTEGNQRKCLKPGDAPVARFALCEGEQVVSAQAYCNLHGLWKAKA